MACRQRLSCRPRGAADEVLGLPLDPEVRRIIGKIRQDRDERNVATCGGMAYLTHAVGGRAIEVRNQRYDQIGSWLQPEPGQSFHLLAMRPFYQQMQDWEHGRDPGGKVVLENAIVEVFGTDAREASQHIDR